MKKAIRIFLIILCLSTLCLSVYKLSGYVAEDKRSSSAFFGLRSEAVRESDTAEPPVNVNFSALKKQNSDIIGWLYSADTPIDYPILKSSDNKDYLRRLPDGSYNRSGSIFLDCCSSPDFSDFVSVIYGHNMKNDTMLGTLTDYSSQSYFDKHSVMYMLTPDADYRIEIISGFRTDEQSYVYDIPYENDEAGREYIRLLADVSDFKSPFTAEESDRYVIMSTCSYSGSRSRYVLLGRLVRL